MGMLVGTTVSRTALGRRFSGDRYDLRILISGWLRRFASQEVARNYRIRKGIAGGALEPVK